MHKTHETGASHMGAAEWWTWKWRRTYIIKHEADVVFTCVFLTRLRPYRVAYTCVEWPSTIFWAQWLWLISSICIWLLTQCPFYQHGRNWYTESLIISVLTSVRSTGFRVINNANRSVLKSRRKGLIKSYTCPFVSWASRYCSWRSRAALSLH